MSMWEVKLFENNNRTPVQDFILSLDKKTVSKTLWMINTLEASGTAVGMPYVRRLAKNLYELRIRKMENVRFLFAFKANVIYILHGFKKKKMKILPKELNIAKNRLTQI